MNFNSKIVTLSQASVIYNHCFLFHYLVTLEHEMIGHFVLSNEP